MFKSFSFMMEVETAREDDMRISDFHFTKFRPISLLPAFTSIHVLPTTPAAWNLHGEALTRQQLGASPKFS